MKPNEKSSLNEVETCVEQKWNERWERPEQPEYMAHFMGVDKKFALRARWRYLNAENKRMSSSDHPIVQVWIHKNLEEMKKLEESAGRVVVELVENPNKITPEMIAQAKQVPVTNIVDFSRRKALAWCHEDKRPSLFHGTKFNIAVCPVCDKKFDTIGVLMKRDGFEFAEAVRHLCML